MTEKTRVVNMRSRAEILERLETTRRHAREAADAIAGYDLQGAERDGQIFSLAMFQNEIRMLSWVLGGKVIE